MVCPSYYNLSYYNPFTKEKIGTIGFKGSSVDFIKHENGKEFTEIRIYGEVFHVKEDYSELSKTIFK